VRLSINELLTISLRIRSYYYTTGHYNCNNCHNEKVAAQFDHAKKTGWALNKYHIKLSCVKCHGEKIPYKKLNNKCVSCHQNWNNETFKHSITGLQLDETHLDFSCEDCHTESNFGIKPNCDGCHDGYVFPKQKPGKLTSK